MSDPGDVVVVRLAAPTVKLLSFDRPDALAGARIVAVRDGTPGDAATSRTRLDDLYDVDAPPAQVGVLTRSEPGGDASFLELPVPQRHTQTVPATRWQITHHLGYRPHFDVRDTEGRPHLPEVVEHPIPGELSEIVFGLPMSGTADPS